jgi:hypothetical protein
MWGHLQDGPRRPSPTPHPHPIGNRMEANGVAREFWNEVFDLRASVREGREKRSVKVRQKKVRRVAGPRPPARSA